MFYEGLDAQEKANKAALLLAHDRYNVQLSSFVKGSARRLAYVQDKVETLLDECATETGADLDYVRDRFAAFLRESVPSALPEDSYKIKNEPSIEDLNKTDIMEKSEVEGKGIDEALKVDEVIDLGEYTLPYDRLQPTAANLIKKAMTAKDFVLIASVLAQNNADPSLVNAFADALAHTNEMFSRERFVAAASGSPMSGRDAPRPPFDSVAGKCVRCGNAVEKIISKQGGMACVKCTVELRQAGSKEADMSWSEQGGQQPNYNDPANGLAAPEDPNMPFVCTICGRSGTKDEILQHVNTDHADVLKRQHDLQVQPGQQPGGYQQPMASKEADVTDGQNPAVVPPLQETPGDHFDDIVQDLAAQAAARHFSLPDEQQIHSIASQLGLPVDEVKNSLVTVATFGNYTGTNGELGGEGNPPDGYEAIQVQSGNGNDMQQAKIPTNLVVQKVADDMNLEADLAYNMIRDKYGADLPETYHAQVQGQQMFYLPSQMAQNQVQQQPQQPQQPVDPNVGPAFQQTPPGAPFQQPAAQPGQIPQQ